MATLPIPDALAAAPPPPSAQPRASRSSWWRRDWRGFALPLALIALWWAATTWRWVDTSLVATPLAVLRTTWQQISGGFFLDALLHSLGRAGSGFAIGVTAGLVVGTALGWSRWADRLISPTFNAVRQIALFAWIPLLSVWFGMGEPAKVVFVSLAVFIPIVLAAYEGTRSVPLAYVEVARAYRFSRWQLLRRVVLPAATPQILTGVHLALIYAWLATIGAEYFFKAGPGIGNAMIDGREHFRMDLVLFGVAVVAVVGITLNVIATRIERRLLRWRPAQH